MTTKRDIWTAWSERYIDAEHPVPLFETDGRWTVQHKRYGQNNRRILERSPEMESLLRTEGRKLITDWSTSGVLSVEMTMPSERPGRRCSGSTSTLTDQSPRTFHTRQPS
jgi:hypothetical protein